jgi:hypothetical protein
MGAREHDVAQVFGPVRQRRELGAGRRAQADHGDPAEAPPPHDGVGRVRRPEHHPRHAAACVAQLAEHDREGGPDAAGHVFGGGPLRPRDHVAVGVEHDRVGVRASDVDADREVPEPRLADRGAHRATSAVGVAAPSKGT